VTYVAKVMELAAFTWSLAEGRKLEEGPPDSATPTPPKVELPGVKAPFETHDKRPAPPAAATRNEYE
jgi:hypothetical protein